MGGIQKRLIVLIALFGLAALYLTVTPLGGAVPLKKTLGEFPFAAAGWNGSAARLPEDQRILVADKELFRSYTGAGGKTVYLYISHVSRYARGDSAFLGRYIAPGSGWDLVRERVVEKRAGGKAINVKEDVFGNGRECASVLYFYLTGRGVSVDRDMARLTYALDVMTGRATNVTLVRVSTAGAPVHDCGFRDDAWAFVDAVLPRLTDFLPFEL